MSTSQIIRIPEKYGPILCELPDADVGKIIKQIFGGEEKLGGLCKIYYDLMTVDMQELNKEYGGITSYYEVKLTGNGETFYKVGIAMDVSRRLYHYSSLGYSTELILVDKFTNRLEALRREKSKLYKLRYAGLSYKPSISFGGETECFSSLTND